MDAKQLEDARLHDVYLLLEHLFEREEVTVKLLLDCLYDTGSVNLINTKFKSRFANGTMKSVARLSKPAFRVVAWHWFKSNCPQILTDWLRGKITFQSASPPKKAPPKSPSPEPKMDAPAAQNAQLTSEIRQLRSQVSLLTGLLIGAIAVFGGGLFWLYTRNQPSLQPAQNLRSVHLNARNRQTQIAQDLLELYLVPNRNPIDRTASLSEISALPFEHRDPQIRHFEYSPFAQEYDETRRLTPSSD